jgi:protein-export membrane protein SecD
MLYFSRLKAAAVIGACLIGILLCLPNFWPAPKNGMPWPQIHLGLDLRGGSFLLMQVDMDAVAKEKLGSTVDQVRQDLRKSGIGYTRLAADVPANQVQIELLDPSQRQAAISALNDLLTPPSGPASLADFDASGEGTSLILTLSKPAMQARATAAVTQSIEIVRRRIDSTGIVDPQIAQQGENRLMVQLPGISDPQHIKKLLGETAHMTFHLVDESVNPNAGTPAPIGDAFLPMQGDPHNKVAIQQAVMVDGADLTNAQAGQDPQTGGWVVNITFDSVGARQFAEVTSANVGHPFAIVLDNEVISAPVIREAITGGSAQISGSANAQAATDLALLLRAGALPAPLTVIEEQSVGPELGADSIRAGAISLVVGFVLVILFMAGAYGLFGWFANIALVANLVMMMGILSLIGATLTLPGMAGILLTLGMAVDANILINERVREEVKNGRTPLAALEAGYKRAYGTIIDSNVTALLAHVMLFIFGSGPVRGFAVTITVGIVTTLFTATIFARLLTSRWYVSRRPTALPV